MNKFHLVFLLVSVLIYPQTFHSLSGLENADGQTLLQYRLGSSSFPYNPIYELNTITGSERLLMEAFINHYPGGDYSRAVWDYEFFPDNINNFIDVGKYTYPDDFDFIARNDSDVFTGMYSGLRYVDISKQNPLKVFVFPGLIRSWDGGYSFPEDSIPGLTNFIPYSMADFDDNTFFGFNEDGEFCRNGAVEVDTQKVFADQYFRMLYDKDQQHIYRTNKSYWSYRFNVSNNLGYAFTWTNSFFSYDPIFVALDSLAPGLLYINAINAIWVSNDYGYDFSFYHSFPYKIHGLYKKPGTEILYAATRYRIYKITPDSSVEIKSVPVPPELVEYYPLQSGDKWVYDYYIWDYYPPFEITHHITTKEILGDSIGSNGKLYKIVHDHSGMGPGNVLERIDTIAGRIYRSERYPGPLGDDYLIDDLSAEIGDSIDAYRYESTLPGEKTVLAAEDSLVKWGFTLPRKIFEQNSLLHSVYSLTKKFGLDSASFYYDFGHSEIILKGCVLNGTVYGDTLTTTVSDYLYETPYAFMLYQNYPNPFNPDCRIRFSLPARNYVTLKVYDILGRELSTLLSAEKGAGNYEVRFEGNDLPSGVYIYKLIAGEFRESRKMILLK